MGLTSMTDLSQKFRRSRRGPEGNSLSIAYLGTAIVLIATYFSLLWLYAVNIPIADDYDTVFAFYLNYDQIESSSQLAHLFFAQHNEHRLFFDRLVFFAERLIAGEADLRRLIVIGNLALVGIFFLFFRIYRNSEIFPLIILAAPLLLFNFMSFETMFWAMASLSNFYVVFFSLMSFVLLTEYKEHRYFLGALTVAALSLYTQANGLLALLIGMLWLGWKTYESPSVQNKIYSGLWLGVTLLVVVFYFSSYTKPPHHPSIIESIKDPTYTLEYFFAFLGSPLSYLGTRASIISGLFIFVLFLYLTR